MKTLIFGLLVLVIFSVNSCHDKDAPTFATCENFSDGYVIGFDPCSGVGNPNGGTLGFAIYLPINGDTVVAYNFPTGIYDFPLGYFGNYKYYPFFPEEAREDFPVKIKYRYAKKEEFSVKFCTGDIVSYPLFSNIESQIILLSITK